MAIISIYDIKGEQVNQLEINDTLTYINGRVSKGTKAYYKGVGIPYRNHYSLHYNPKNYVRIKKSDVFYLGDTVWKRCFGTKVGIFQEKFQPQFTDFIGTCGVKELSIIENSEDFQKSSVIVERAELYDSINNQSYFKLQYSCGRVKYTEKGNPAKLYDLLKYMIENDWNFIWDKNSIGDISADGNVSDVADIFKSRDLVSKFGTVYSVLYSLAATNFPKYLEFLNHLNLSHHDQSNFIFNTRLILMNFGHFQVINTGSRQYEYLLFNFLLPGRNCGHCCYENLGEEIKEEYIRRTKKLYNVYR